MPLQVPSQIGRYRILGLIRRRRLGWLYHGRDERLGSDVWLKTLDLSEAVNAPALARFFQKARIVSCFNHPSIITIKAIGQCEGIPYMVFEALEGQTLFEAMKGGISLKAGLPLILQVLEGLAHIHQAGIVHSNVKPTSIFVCNDCHAKIINFGIARIVDARPRIPAKGRLVGTPPYMSPEQARRQRLDGRSDLFAVGCVLYEMVTGKKAFSADSLKGALVKVLAEEPGMDLVPDASEWRRLRGVITKALQKKPEDRYPDALAMRADLALALKKLGDSADWTPPARGKTRD
jgi:serine/threonine-protein kinase